MDLAGIFSSPEIVRGMNHHGVVSEKKVVEKVDEHEE